MRRVLLLALLVLVAVFAWMRPREAGRRAPQRAADVANGSVPEVVSTGKPGPVSGKVLPACRARVHWYDYGKGDAPAATVEVAEDGTFAFPESVGERGVLLAEADGFRPCWFAMRDFSDATLALEPGGPLPYRVTDPEANPIPDAQVEVWHRFALSGHYTRTRLATDSDGVVEVNAGPEERFTIAAEGFDPQTIPHPERADDRRCRTFVLVPRLRIRGRVVDPLGHPVRGAVVRYRKDGDGRSFRIESSEARVGADARFETPPLHAQAYEVQAAAPGWAEARAVAWPGADDVVLRVDRPARIEGRVLLPTGAPAADVELWVDGADPNVDTASDGSFALEGLPAGPVTLRAYWWGPTNGPGAPDETTWRCSWPFDLRAGESRTGVELTLSGSYYSWAPLRLVDARGAPLAGVPVDTGSLSVLGEGEPTTDENGFVLIRTEDAPGYETRFEFPAAATGLPVDYSCRIVTVPPGTTEAIEVKLPAPVRVTFVVRDEKGVPIPPEAAPRVVVEGTDDAPVGGDRVEVLVVSDDEDPRMDYRAYASGFARVCVEDWVPDPAGETIEIRMRRVAVLRGVVATADGRPLASLPITCDGSRVETDDGGAFEFDWLAPGPAILRVRLPESPLPIMRRQLELRPGVNDLGVLEAPAPETVRGCVADATGRPVGGARIDLLEPGSESLAVATTREDGTFFLRVCDPNAVRVMARKPGFCAAIGGGEDLSITLLPDRTVRLRVPPEIYWSRVRIKLPDGAEFRPECGWQADTLRLEQLPPGPLTVVFTSDPDGRVVASCTDRETVIPWR